MFVTSLVPISARTEYHKIAGSWTGSKKQKAILKKKKKRLYLLSTRFTRAVRR